MGLALRLGAVLVGMLCLGASLAGGSPRAGYEVRLAELEPLHALRLGAEAPDFPAEIWPRVLAGEVVTGLEERPGHEAMLGWGVAVLAVDHDTLWRAVNEDLWHGEILELDHVEVVKGRACEGDRQVLRVMPVPVLSDRWWVVQYAVNGRLHAASGGRARELRWEGVDDAVLPGMSAQARALVEGKVRVVENVGSWFLAELDEGHTLAEYYALSDPGGRVPAGLASSLASGRIEENLRAMERYAQTASPRCPVP